MWLCDTIEDVKNSYNNILKTSKKVIAIVGDVKIHYATELLEKYLSDIPTSCTTTANINPPSEIVQESVEIIKNDAQQAQIVQGWKVPQIGTPDYPKLMLLNVILGASGLSSRLFMELREKKGLAYTVRSSYEVLKQSAVFSIYIGTEPTNIQASIEGFKEEIEKIKTIPISEEELHNAKNNIIGKQQFITETNSQQSSLMAYYAISEKPFDYQKEVIEDIKNVTAKDLQDVANKYLNENFVLAMIKPQV